MYMYIYVYISDIDLCISIMYVCATFIWGIPKKTAENSGSHIMSSSTTKLTSVVRPHAKNPVRMVKALRMLSGVSCIMSARTQSRSVCG